MLVDSEILGIDDINLWSPRSTPDGFSSYAVGVSMWMTLDQFCKFIDKIQGDETMCITIQGFRVTNSALRSFADPALKIDLVFQIDEYRPAPTPEKTASAKPAGPASAKLGPKAPAAPGDQPMDDVKNRRAAGRKVTSRSPMPWWRRMLPW